MKYIQIKSEDTIEIEKLSVLASAIVKEHFDPIIGAVQNSYMIARFQSAEAIAEQLRHGYGYYFAQNDDDETVGFLAFYPRGEELYLSKFYLKKEWRGQGLSRLMLEFVRQNAIALGRHSIVLNVNRNNDAILAYERLGFVKIREEVNDIGNGFVMDDYVYELGIRNEEWQQR